MDDQESPGEAYSGDSSGTDGVPPFLRDLYRGELDRVTTWRGRLDQTINWAVTIMAAVLTWVFSSSDNPHYLLLIGMLTVMIFHVVETRRYRTYDVFRSRVRLIEEDVFAAVLDPTEGAEHENWRAELAKDLRRPALKTSFGEASARRLRRVYLPLLVVLLAAWVTRITVFTPEEGPLASAAMVGVPGIAVITVVVLAYLAAIGFAYWPRERQAKGELYDRDEEGEWKDE
jgi:uncharacterized membrane protein